MRVPFIVRAPGAPAGRRMAQDVSLVDVTPTILGFADGTGSATGSGDLRGRNLRPLIEGEGPEDMSRRLGEPVFSEYHTIGMEHAAYMIKQGRYKYNYYVNNRPELFDLDEDPDELHNVAGDPARASICEALHRALLDVVDPQETDRRAKENQARPRYNGGE